MKLLIALALGLAVAATSSWTQLPTEVLKPGIVLSFERISRVDQNSRPTDDRSTYTHKIESVNDGKIAVTETGRAGQRTFVAMSDFQFPLSPGKEWNHELERNRVSAWGVPSNYRWTGKARVAGEETLSLAGQSVPTLRVEISGWITRIGGGGAYGWQYERTDWYAPSIGYVVQSEYREIEKGRRVSDIQTRLSKIEVP